RQRAKEDDESILACEHTDEAANRAAFDRSARLLADWESKDPLVREKALERLGREMAGVHDVPAATLIVKDMPPEERGYYDDAEFMTAINRRELEQADPTKALETYLHEYRHAEQAQELQKSHNFAVNEVDVNRAHAIEANSGDAYIQPET